MNDKIKQLRLDEKQTRAKALRYIKQCKAEKKINYLVCQTGFSKRWFYKVNDGSIKPSHSRCIDILELYIKECEND